MADERNWYDKLAVTVGRRIAQECIKRAGNHGHVSLSETELAGWLAFGVATALESLEEFSGLKHRGTQPGQFRPR